MPKCISCATPFPCVCGRNVQLLMSFRPAEPAAPTQEGVKHDQGKLRMDLLPMDAIREVAAIMTFGANKYGDRNWEKGMDWGRLIGALHRHLAAFQMGDDLDEETGLPHIAHAATCALFLLSYQIRGIGTDDRHHVEPTP